MQENTKMLDRIHQVSPRTSVVSLVFFVLFVVMNGCFAEVG
jgi:hypothetical protein